MLMDYLNLSRNVTKIQIYIIFICGSQVYWTFPKSNYLWVINAFTQIETAKAFLFANLSFQGKIGILRFQGIFFGKSPVLDGPENVGVNTRLFKDEDDFFGLFKSFYDFYGA